MKKIKSLIITVRFKLHTKKLFILYASFFSLIISALNSCKDENAYNHEPYSLNKNSTSYNDSISCINGMLNFTSPKIFLEFIKRFEFSSDGESISDKYGYTSIESIYCNLQEEFANINDSVNITKFANLNKKYIILDDSLFIQPRIQSYIYRVICNQDGLYSIGNTIYEVLDQDIKVHNKTKNNKPLILQYAFAPQVLTKGDTQTNQYVKREYKNKQNDKIVGLNVHAFFYYSDISDNTKKYNGTYKIQFHSYGKYRNFFGNYKSYKTRIHFDGLVYRFRIHDNTEKPKYIMGGAENYNLQSNKDVNNFYATFEHNNNITYSGYISQPIIEVLRVRARSRATGDCGVTVNSFPINDYRFLSTCK
ncbi:MAG: hypothetical protein ACRCTQ_00010 [Brevinemataceae bacterium]